MSGQPTIEITPGVLRLGAEVIQLAHVTSLRVRRRRPLLVPAVGLLLLGLGLLSPSEALAGRIGLGGGSVSLPRLVAAGLLVGLGLLLPGPPHVRRSSSPCPIEPAAASDRLTAPSWTG